MTTDELYDLEPSQSEMAVLAWRYERLHEAGYSPTDSDLLASDPNIDLHHAVDLVENGCDPSVAARILL